MVSAFLILTPICFRSHTVNERICPLYPFAIRATHTILYFFLYFYRSPMDFYNSPFTQTAEAEAMCTAFCSLLVQQRLYHTT